MNSSESKLRTPGELLELALEKEKAAFLFYSNLLNNSRVEMVRDLVAKLKDEEEKHIHMVEKRIAEMNLG